jgi:hypothetical protein
VNQLILHLIGDYVTQSDWMAQRKTKSTWAAFVHATVYSMPKQLRRAISAARKAFDRAMKKEPSRA